MNENAQDRALKGYGQANKKLFITQAGEAVLLILQPIFGHQLH
jgi:hypothetical protein